MKKIIAAIALCAATLHAEDVVRLGNLKFAHYGAVSYMKEIAPKYGLKIEEKVFGKGLDIVPAIVAGDIDIAASSLDAAIAGRAARALVMTEKMSANKALAERVLRCFVDATKTFLREPALAEKYVRDTVFKGQLTHEEYVDAMSNAAFTYDINVKHVQVTTDMMQQLAFGRMEKPPDAASWAKLHLHAKAKRALGVR